MNKDGLDKDQSWVIEQVGIELPKALVLSEPDRSRCLLCLAYEYFNVDMEEEAFKILSQSDPDYFKNGQLGKDMKEIKDMDKIVFAIMGKLLSAGYIKIEEEKKDN